MRLRHALLLLALLSGCAETPAPAPAPPPAPAQPPAPSLRHDVELAAGRVDIVSLKNGDTEVPGRFQAVRGKVSIDPLDLRGTTGVLTIEMGSWNSDVELRDTRMKEIFFDVAGHPTTTFTLTGLEQPSGALTKVGDKATATANGKLTWRAVEQELSLPVELTRTAEQSYAVRVPSFEISIDSLDMADPLKALITACEHESVGDAVKVSLDLSLGVQPVSPEPPPDASAGAAPEGGAEVAPRPLDRGAPEGDRPLERPEPATGGERALPKSGE